MTTYGLARTAMIAAGLSPDVVLNKMFHKGGGQYVVQHADAVHTVHVAIYPAKHTLDGDLHSPAVDADEPGAIEVLPARSSVGPMRVEHLDRAAHQRAMDALYAH